jgi:hypothetical protein
LSLAALAGAVAARGSRAEVRAGRSGARPTSLRILGYVSAAIGALDAADVRSVGDALASLASIFDEQDERLKEEWTLLSVPQRGHILEARRVLVEDGIHGREDALVHLRMVYDLEESGSKAQVRQGRSRHPKAPRERVRQFDIVNPREAIYRQFNDLILYRVQLDDRGDLCVFVWADDADGAMELGEGYAQTKGWRVDERDTRMFEVSDDATREAVYARSIEDTDE